MSEVRDYVIGIDTGGTYTDAVLLDYNTRNVIEFSKTLTTHDNLARGITTALKNLRINNADNIRLVGVSSTLATNSIAEGKERKAGLILIGYDRDLITTYDLAAKFPTRHWANFKGGHTSQGLEQESLDRRGIKQWVQRNADKFDALAISAYFSPLNPLHEEQALAVIRQTCTLPAVLGHHLSTRLDSIKRATTACLNASLVAVMQEFIEAMREALVDRGIQAPLMVVKGDGSLISDAEAILRPVETVLSGPAASAIGGRFLSGSKNALVVDVGGTTTDLALIEGLKVTLSDEGARVGMFETAVKAARIRTAAMGGDSRIVIDTDGDTRVGPERVVPLSRLAAMFPRVKTEIAALGKKRELDRRISDLEYWFLNRDNSSQLTTADNTRSQQLTAILRDGPLSLTVILKKLNIYHPLQLGADDLIRKGLIEKATLTPTDLLHATGGMDTWCTDTARRALAYACKLFSLNPESFAKQTLGQLVAAMVREAVIFLVRRSDEGRLPGQIEDAWGRWFLNQAIGDSSPYLAVSLSSRFPITGIGAPAEIFVKRMADQLRASFILPDYAPVANAVGAVAGSIIVEKEAIVYIREKNGAKIYFVQIDGENKSFTKEESACEYAIQTVLRLAKEGAVAAGADEPQTMTETRIEGHLKRHIARGIGNPRL